MGPSFSSYRTSMFIELGEPCPTYSFVLSPPQKERKEEDTEIICLEVAMLRKDVIASENKTAEEGR